MLRSDYDAKLAWVEQHAPDCPHLERLRRGMTITNESLIARVIADLPPPPPEVDPDKPKGDGILQRISRDLNKLYTERAKLSNELHLIGDDMERGYTIMCACENIQAIIADTMRRRDHYINTAELLPTKVVSNEYEIPTDPFMLLKKQSVLRSSISRKKNDIEKAKDKAKKQMLKDQLFDYETHLKYVDQKISLITR